MEQKRVNIFMVKNEFFVVTTEDQGPHALEDAIAEYYNLDPQDDNDCDYVMEVLDEDVTDIAHDVPIELVDMLDHDALDNSNYVICRF